MLQAEGAAGGKAQGQTGSGMFREEKRAQPVRHGRRLMRVWTGGARSGRASEERPANHGSCGSWNISRDP